MARKKKTITPESEDEVYERFLKKLLKDPRFKQYKPMAIKALAARGYGGGGRSYRGGGRGRSSGMIQTPNQDNFIKIQSSILDMNTKLEDFTNQMKRGMFNTWMYQQGYQGNAQPSGNYPPPTSASSPQSMLEHKIITARPYQSSVDDISESDLNEHRLLLQNYKEHIAEEEAMQGHAEHSPNVLNVQPYEIHDTSTQTETRMYDTADMLSVMSHGSILARLNAHGIDTKRAPHGVDRLRESTSQLYNDELQKSLSGVQGAIDLNLLQSGPRGRPRLADPVIEPVEDGEED
jgi:hypothetical protein